MKENNKNQQQNFALPPTWCSAICRNAMNEICVEHCAITRDMSGFDPKPDVSLLDMSRFPIKDASQMTKEERFTIVAIYLSKIVDYLQGDEHDNSNLIFGRSYIDHTRSGTLSESFKIETILSSLNEANSALEVGTKREDQEFRPSEVVDSTD